MSRLLRERPLAGSFRLTLAEGDLTRHKVDAIVNAANERLDHGGGLARALAVAGGASIQEQSDAWVRARGPVATGRAALTGAGELPAKAIIHAVGPVWRGGHDGEDEALASAVHEALLTARAHRFKSVAMPAISAGIYGFPAERCARVMLAEVARFARVHQSGDPRDIRIVLKDPAVIDAFLWAWEESLKTEEARAA